MAAKSKAWIIGLALMAGLPATAAFGQAADNGVLGVDHDPLLLDLGGLQRSRGLHHGKIIRTWRGEGSAPT